MVSRLTRPLLSLAAGNRRLRTWKFVNEIGEPAVSISDEPFQAKEISPACLSNAGYGDGGGQPEVAVLDTSEHVFGRGRVNRQRIRQGELWLDAALPIKYLHGNATARAQGKSLSRIVI